MECHGGRLMECHDDRKSRARESNVALQDLEKTTLSTRARSQKLGQGQRTVYEQAKTPEVQNTVMDDRRADPTAGEKEHSQLQARTSSGRLAAASVGNEGPGRGLGQDEVQDKQQNRERHESCGQHGRQEL